MKRVFAGSLLGILLVPTAVEAQEGPAQRAGLEITPIIGAFDDRPEFSDSDILVDPEKGVLFGGLLGYGWANGFFIEAEVNRAPMESEFDDNRIGLDAMNYTAWLGFGSALSERVQLFGEVGGGATSWSPEGMDSETDIHLGLGAGMKFFFSNNVGLRLGASYRFLPTALESTTTALGTAQDETFKAIQLTAGLAIKLGSSGPGDSDGDGVTDDMDQCPNTPAGRMVDARGCEMDDDGDGVVNGVDECPNTPRGATVDGRGCPSDSDNDGVFNGIDQCPNTPNGVEVNNRGCPVDSDGDGVFNGPDQCPNTPRGTEVDTRGCPVPQPEPEPEPIPTFESVLFAVDSAELDAAARRILDQAGAIFRERGELRITISGHTDATATETYNQGLSERRAEAVVAYLSQNFGISRSRFSVSAFGESRPVAGNDDESGRRQNRRVEITASR